MNPPSVFRADATPVELYRQPGVRVTSEMFIVAGHRFPISELSNLRTARGPQDRLTLRSVLITATAVAATGIVLGYAGELHRLSARTYLLLGLATFVPMALGALGQRLRPPAYELWGRYRGSMTLLFSSDQERQFGQVRGALLRACAGHRQRRGDETVVVGTIWQPRER